jgi:NodT family efflux transporter outer membrane factor (OMF) lipoprotein
MQKLLAPTPSLGRRLKYWAGASALAVTLAGCAIPPPSGPLAPPSSPASYASRQSLAAPGADWPSDHWWTDYQDPQLQSLIEEGLAAAPDMRVAASRIAQANAAAAGADSALLPALNGHARAGGYVLPQGAATPPGVHPLGFGTLDLNWDLDFWGKNHATAAAAHDQAQAAQAEAANTRLVLSTAIASAYGDLARLYAELDAAQDAARVRAQTEALIRQRFAEGLENQSAVDLATSDRAAAQEQVAEQQQKILLTRNGIAALLGAGPDRGLAITRPAALTQKTFGLPADLQLNLIGRRPDIIAAKLQAEAAASRIKAAKAAFYPNVNLSASIGLEAFGLGNLIKPGSGFGSAGPALSLPIFDGGQLRAQYRGAEAAYQIAVAQYDGALVEALHQVANAATNERALGNELTLSRDAEASAAAALRTADGRYRGGLGTYLDVLTAENALITARRQVADLESSGFTIDVSLIRALGGGFHS